MNQTLGCVPGTVWHYFITDNKEEENKYQDATTPVGKLGKKKKRLKVDKLNLNGTEYQNADI